MRRALLALTLSLGVHLGVLVTAVAVGAWGTLSLAPNLNLQTIAIDVKDLPLGAQPQANAPGEPEAPRPRRSRAPRVRNNQGVTIAAHADAGPPEPDAGASDARSATPDAGAGHDGGTGHRKPGDLRAYGPEGSRLTALLRLDRLRTSTGHAGYVTAIDQLLKLLPDRRRLMEGTGLDLFRDFDALLIATPNPRDAAVTFLAVRHHLKDNVLKSALSGGADTAGRPIEWSEQEGRPVGVRAQPKAAPDQPAIFDRDDRIFVLPQRGLAVIATPAYAQLLLGRKTAGARPDGGTSRLSWNQLVARIDAEDSAMPEDAVFMLSFSLPPQMSSRSLVVPGTRGATDDDSPAPGAPAQITLVAGTEPTPFVDLYGDFENERDATAWEQNVLPAWKQKALTNPLLVLSGFTPLLGRAEIARDERTLTVHIGATADELQRLLNMAANLTRNAQAGQ
jgi:hypothetical protein